MWSATTFKELAQIAHTNDLGSGFYKMLKEVDIVIVVNALHHGGNALKPHTGINRRLGQRGHFSTGIALELHKNQVPNFNIAIEIVVFTAGRTAWNVFTMVPKYFCAWTARAGIAHLPKIVFVESRQSIGIDTNFIHPNIGGFIIADMNGHPQPLFWKAEHLGEKFPAEANRVALKVIAKTEVTQHLKESVVARGVAHIFEVIMLAAGSHTALRRHSSHVVALFCAKKDVFELHHTGIGEQQCRVVARHQTAAWHNLMTLTGEIV